MSLVIASFLNTRYNQGMKRFLWIFLIGGIFVAAPLLAQTDNTTVTDVSVGATEEFSDEGITDADLEMDLEAEALPSDGLSFRWENIWFGLRRAFIFNAEKKAELDRQRLHQLDRKLTACADVGDEGCMQRIQERITRAQELAEKHLQKKQEILAKHRQRFEEWRAKRQARLEELKERAAQRKERREELLKQRQERRQEVQERRKKHRQEVQERIQQMRQEENVENAKLRTEQRMENKLRPEQRMENRERLIELRSQNLKNTLDDTRKEVNERQEEINSAQQELEAAR